MVTFISVFFLPFFFLHSFDDQIYPPAKLCHPCVLFGGHTPASVSYPDVPLYAAIVHQVPLVLLWRVLL